MQSDGDEVRIRIGFLHRCQNGAAALRIGHDAEELPAFLARMKVKVVTLDDRLAISRLERGIAERADFRVATSTYCRK